MTYSQEDRIIFYKCVEGEIPIADFEKWVYQNPKVEELIGKDLYLDLISFPFNSNENEVKNNIRSLIKLRFDWLEFEKWRTISLLEKIVKEEIEIVLGTRRMCQLYREQEDNIKWPLLSITLAIGYESELDNCPTPDEYHAYSAETLQRLLEPISWYKDSILKLAERELKELLSNETKTIDLSLILKTKEVHELFWKELRFPDFYGANWDAFWDCIANLTEMPAELILLNWEVFEKRLPQDASILNRIIIDYNKEQKKSKIIINK